MESESRREASMDSRNNSVILIEQHDAVYVPAMSASVAMPNAGAGVGLGLGAAGVGAGSGAPSVGAAAVASRKMFFFVKSGSLIKVPAFFFLTGSRALLIGLVLHLHTKQRFPLSPRMAHTSAFQPMNRMCST